MNKKAHELEDRGGFAEHVMESDLFLRCSNSWVSVSELTTEEEE